MTGDRQARIEQLDRAMAEVVIVLSSVGIDLTEDDVKAVRHILLRLMR